MAKRDDLITELLRRLKSGFSGTRIYAGDGGVWGKWGRYLPVIHYYESPADQVLIKPGKYDITLPIQIEYFTRLGNKKDLFPEGREKLNELQAAIELDERFKSDDIGNELVYTYSMVANEIVEVLDHVVGIAVIYEFKFTDVFLGYEQYRH